MYESEASACPLNAVDWSSKRGVLNRNGLQLVKSNAKDHLFYLIGGWEARNTNYKEKIWALSLFKPPAYILPLSFDLSF